MSEKRKTAIARTIVIHSDAHLRDSLKTARNAAIALQLSGRVLQEQALIENAMHIESLIKSAEQALDEIDASLDRQQVAAETYRAETFGHLEDANPNVVSFEEFRGKPKEAAS